MSDDLNRAMGRIEGKTDMILNIINEMKEDAIKTQAAHAATQENHAVRISKIEQMITIVKTWVLAVSAATSTFLFLIFKGLTVLFQHGN